MKVTQGPTTWKGIELIPVGTKVTLFNKEWVITAHCHSYYALKFEGLGHTGKTTVAFKSTESLRKNIVP